MNFFFFILMFYIKDIVVKKLLFFREGFLILELLSFHFPHAFPFAQRREKCFVLFFKFSVLFFYEIFSVLYFSLCTVYCIFCGTLL